MDSPSYLQTPFVYAVAQAIGFDPERFTDSHKRKRPVSCAVRDPGLSLKKHSAIDARGRLSAGLQTTQSVFQHRQHQALTRFDGARPGPLEVLPGEQDLDHRGTVPPSSARLPACCG